ncbi:DNA/RNA nuclease SfsA [Clostridium folliculivorans]|uniref:DNA/RNA nuclease SfsA n=1 Tax=Clostridium folliculivorans TaxID=2886038 RepID=UPI0021C3E354|nr:DNA/RNA nuclease SfsA [Clostridium folliculivorans]
MKVINVLIEKPVLEAVFVKRPNRFQGYVILDNKEIMTHVPNTGRCKEILIPGTKVILRKEDSPERKTQYDLIAAYKGETLISIDSHIPNRVVQEALINKMIPSLEKYNIIMREKTFGNSRFDFKLSDGSGSEYYLEVKGVTLEKNGVASFPDAPTERGRKHLLELVEAKRQGKGAGVIFLIQLDDIKTFTPHDETDPEFGEALRYAAKNGVDVFAYCSEVTPDSITLKREVQVIL